MRYYLCCGIGLFLVLMACKKEPAKAVADVLQNKDVAAVSEVKVRPAKVDMNISVFLDLSDRIDPEKYPNPAMEFYERDLGYINAVTRTFENHVLHKKIRDINDYLQIYLDPEPADKTLNAKIRSLNTGFNRYNAHKDSILETSRKYDSITRIIYETAIADQDFVGSDIWGFFKTKVKSLCIRKGFRNVLVVLTDGYIYHENTRIKQRNRTSYFTPQDIRREGLNSGKWMKRKEEGDYGLIPATDGLDSLEVLVLGINPDKKNPYEADVMVGYWEEWLLVMGVRRFEIKTALLPADMNKIIVEFLSDNP
ncbi:hypothetical protein [Sinomicrobium oceani]|uniref:hypothetical protein n=1 Tax=Sinomicrobium oceani TaxID=1150368 RepID=UPI00227B0592|nr:hypothetical protein [Sinomicrobium oceani]